LEIEGFSPELSRQVAESREIAQSVSDELRTTSYLFHRPLLDEMGLQAGLRWYIAEFDARLNLPENLQRLPPDLELVIFRVVQEALTNIHRHSGSATAAICLCNSIGELTLEIRDQGTGIPTDKRAGVAAPGTAGVGLRGMRERVKGFGGELEILSDGKGTLVRAVIPFRASAPASEG
jgi:signal transduction histidine kinase